MRKWLKSSKQNIAFNPVIIVYFWLKITLQYWNFNRKTMAIDNIKYDKDFLLGWYNVGFNAVYHIMNFPSVCVCIKGKRHGFPISIKGWRYYFSRGNESVCWGITCFKYNYFSTFYFLISCWFLFYSPKIDL